MKSQARVVIIGGGIGGCSALYHLDTPINLANLTVL